MKTCVILNPHAGTVEAHPDILVQLAQKYGQDLWLTQQPKEATTLARTAVARGYEQIVAAGGDGTINEVVNGLAPNFQQVQFGILPVGTGNDFVRSLPIPTDLDQALQMLDAGCTQTIDLMRITTDHVQYCINVSAGGLSGMFEELLDDEQERTQGPLAYLRSATDMLSHLSPYETSVAFDDEPSFDISLYNVVVANARYVAHGIPIAPEAIMDDGLLDVLLIRATSLPQLMLLAPEVVLGQHMDSDQIIARRVQKVAIHSQPGMWFTVEGEVLGKTPATFEVLPQALHIVIQAETGVSRPMPAAHPRA